MPTAAAVFAALLAHPVAAGYVLMVVIAVGLIMTILLASAEMTIDSLMGDPGL